MVERKVFKVERRAVEVVKKASEVNWTCTEVAIELKHTKMVLDEAKEWIA